MSMPLEITARKCLFIVRDGVLTKKLALPSYWQTANVATDEQLWSCIQQSRTSGNKRILILSEESVDATLRILRTKMSSDPTLRLGCVVISRDAEKFLMTKSDEVEVLDVASEKDFKKYPSFHLLRALRQLVRIEDRVNRRVNQETLERLNQIFIALSSERDPQRLLNTILLKAIDLAMAEAGTLFMIQERDGELNFRMAISSEPGHEVLVRPLDLKISETSVCGYVALTGKSIHFADISQIRPMSMPQLQKGIDHFHESHTKSMLTVPLKSSRNEIVAILQLLNKRTQVKVDSWETGHFEPEDESLLSSFATQAAICLENVDLYADIQKLFEGFVKASITAIEARDPSTGGHSERVAKLCVGLARATTECEVGIYRSVRFKDEEIRELEYAALLHDFGKIGVREEVLVKAKKLYPWQLDSIKERIKICKAAVKIQHLEKCLRHGIPEKTGETEYHGRSSEIENYWQIILAANEPAVLKRENIEALEKIRNEQLLLPDGAHIALLTDDEYKALAVTQGSLTESERLEIESHVRHTYQFLKMIPWTRDFKHLPEIAFAHHEKLDGTGYPRGLTSHEIPLQSKIMTIADIYDALTAADRWYKEAVPTEKALDILAQEVSEGKLDPVLFELFVEKRIFEVTQPKLVTKVA